MAWRGGASNTFETNTHTYTRVHFAQDAANTRRIARVLKVVDAAKNTGRFLYVCDFVYLCVRLALR